MSIPEQIAFLTSVQVQVCTVIVLLALGGMALTTSVKAGKTAHSAFLVSGVLLLFVGVTILAKVVFRLDSALFHLK